MAVSDQARNITRFDLITADADLLATFYERTFGCRRIARNHLGGADFVKLMGVEGGAKSLTMLLGDQIIELLQFDLPGRAYPAGSVASDLIFQHFAIVVSDMTRAMQRLHASAGWSDITRGGPQHLPESSGGVIAFKFRDPEGHPLEFLSFPVDKVPPTWRNAHEHIFLGIDHSAIRVAETQASREFYEGLGFRVLASSLNQGPEQDNLDNVANAYVEVTALSGTFDGPHIELLCYRRGVRAIPCLYNSNDIAATRLILGPGTTAENTDVTGRGILDPDGHHLTILDRAKTLAVLSR